MRKSFKEADPDEAMKMKPREIWKCKAKKLRKPIVIEGKMEFVPETASIFIRDINDNHVLYDLDGLWEPRFKKLHSKKVRITVEVID